jgi:branched-chain amino acid transport system permease protein
MAGRPTSNAAVAAAPQATDFASALKDAAFAAFMTLLLCTPIVMIRTDQTTNELALVPRFGLVATAVAIVFFGRLALRLVANARAGSTTPLIAMPASVSAGLSRLTPLVAPLVFGFVIVFPFITYWMLGSGALKWIDNFRHPGAHLCDARLGPQYRGGPRGAA